MNLVFPSFQCLDDLKSEAENMMKLIEVAGRTCYKSEDKITDKSHLAFNNMICNTYKHESVIEHRSITVKIIANRGLTHELVRHRLASFSQESTRYCNYSKGKFGGSVSFIDPSWYYDLSTEKRQILVKAFASAEAYYMQAIDKGIPAEIAREILPIGLKTEIIITANLREWRHIFACRTTKQAHPLIRKMMTEIEEYFNKYLPIYFGGSNES